MIYDNQDPNMENQNFCLILVKGFCPLLDSTQTASTPSIFLRNGDEQSSMYQISFSCSGAVAQRIIVGWLGSEFQTGNSSIKLQKWSCEVWSIILFQRRLENNYVTNHKTLLLKFKAVWEIKKNFCTNVADSCFLMQTTWCVLFYVTTR